MAIVAVMPPCTEQCRLVRVAGVLIFTRDRAVLLVSRPRNSGKLTTARLKEFGRDSRRPGDQRVRAADQPVQYPLVHRLGPLWGSGSGLQQLPGHRVGRRARSARAG